MSGRRSRSKGARGERAFAALLRSLGVEAERGCQREGSPGTPDVKTSIEGVHFEVKRAERLLIHLAMQQAAEDCDSESVPVVAFKRNHRPWLVIMQAEDMFEFARHLARARASPPPSGTAGELPS